LIKWIERQSSIHTAQWDQALKLHHPESITWMNNPSNYLIRLTEECNYLAAASILPWDDLIPANAEILDSACGGGWLSAYLSKHRNTRKIYSLDSSENYLLNFLPAVFELMQGDPLKVTAVQGFFSPILLPDQSLDLVVISSAMHHAEVMEPVLCEFNRVLKKGSHLIILNENPITNLSYLYKISLAFGNSVVKTLKKKYKPYVQKISCGGLVYDPYLGDKIYPEWYWRSALRAAEFDEVILVDSKLTPVVGQKTSEQGSLRHFICRKRD
jgi:ubiquinone/menaquinone biosynthesis C-methylase UbiE